MVFDMEADLDDIRIEQCTNNRLMGEKVQKRIKAHIETLVISYGRVNQKTIDTYSFELYKSGYSANQIEEVVSSLTNDYEKFPTLPEVKKYLSAKFSDDPRKKLAHEKTMRQVKRDREDYQKLKKDFEEKLKWGKKEFDLWTKFYVREVFGEVVMTCEFLGCFEQIALKDLALSNMDQKRAVARGRKEINK